MERVDVNDLPGTNVSSVTSDPSLSSSPYYNYDYYPSYVNNGTLNSLNCTNNSYQLSCLNDEDYVDTVWEYVHPMTLEWIIISLNIFALVVGLLGNYLVCYVVYKNISMQSVTNIFIVNLAVADFCVLLFCLPTTVLWDVTETWFLGKLMCKLILYFQTVSVAVSVLTLAALSVDRWYAVCRPLKCQATPRRAKTYTIIIWMIALTIDIPEALYLETQPYLFERENITTVLLTTCTTTWSNETDLIVTVLRFFLLFLLPLIFMAVAYVQIVAILWHRQLSPPGNSNSFSGVSMMSGGGIGSVGVGAELQIRVRRKAARMLVAVVIIFAICLLPLHVISIVRIHWELSNSPINNILSQISHLMYYANSAVNPIIYNFMSDKFKREFRRAIRCSSNSQPEETAPRMRFRTTSSRLTLRTQRV